MADFIEGPLWTMAVAIFLIGVIWRIGAILFNGLTRDLSPTRGSALTGRLKAIVGGFTPKNQSAKSNLLQIVAGYMFHLGLFALVIFAAPHIDFLHQRYLDFSWKPMPHWAFIVSAQLAFAGLILLWLRRLMHPVSRLLSTFDDHAGTGLTFLAMFTGCLALFESYSQLRILHLLSVELLLIYFPFSNLMHAFTFVFNRSATGARAGRRGI